MCQSVFLWRCVEENGLQLYFERERMHARAGDGAKGGEVCVCVSIVRNSICIVRVGAALMARGFVEDVEVCVLAGGVETAALRVSATWLRLI